MASALPGGDTGLFDQLQSADPAELERRRQTINDRLQATFKQSQERVAALVDENSTLPTTVSSVTILGAPNTRHGFLKRIVDPLLSANRDRPYTQAELVREVSHAADRLARFGASTLHCPHLALT